MLLRRTNLVAASKRTPHIFIAHDDDIGVSPTPTGPAFYLHLNYYDKVINRPYPDDESEGYLIRLLVSSFQEGANVR
jgi:hypothetical protein